jgi:GTP-binding protein
MKIRNATFIKSGTKPAHFPELELPEVAFAGRSNAGKSSLMNCLLLRKDLVRVSSTPGRTQILSWFSVNDEILLCDLPGYGFAKVPLKLKKEWGPMVGNYLQHRSNLRALVIITDARRGFSDDDMMLFESALQLGLHTIFVATKCDKLTRNELYNQKLAIGKAVNMDPETDIVWFSAVTGAGRDQLWERLMNLTGAAPAPELTPWPVDADDE